MPHNYSSVVLTLNNVFILFPPVRGSNRRYFAIFKFFSWLFLAFAAITGGPMSIIVKDKVFSNVATIHKAIYDISAMLLYITNICISGISICKQQMLSALLEEVLEDISSGSKFLINFAAFIVIHLINTMFILLTQLKRTEDIWYQLTVLFVDGYMTFRLITGLFIIFLMINDIRNKMMEINDKLPHCSTTTSIMHWRFRHNNLCDHLQDINNIFGVVLLLIIFYFITTFLRHAVFISVHSEANLVVAVRCLWILSYGFQAVYLAHMGEQIVNQSQNTVSIGYKQMCQWSCLKIPGDRNEIFLLTQQAFNRTTRISAAGFFNVDNSMILFMVTTFFTYFIVVTQLMSARTSA